MSLLRFVGQQICKKAIAEARKLEQAFQAKVKQRHKTVFAPTLQTSPQAAYYAHYENIRWHITVEDFSIVDATIALCMRVNGHSPKAVLGATRDCAPTIRKVWRSGSKGRLIMSLAMLAIGICRENLVISSFGKKLKVALSRIHLGTKCNATKKIYYLIQIRKGMTDIILEIQGRKFPLPIKLLLAIAENFPYSWPYADNKYGPLADAIIGLHIPTLQQALANSHSLSFKQEVCLWKSGDMGTRRILLGRPGFVNRLGDLLIREILAMDDIAMLEKVAGNLRLPENTRELGSTRALNEKTAKELIRILAIHPAQNVRQALLSNNGIPDIYLKELHESD